MSPKPVVLIEYFCTDDVTLVFGVRAEWPEPKVVEIRTPLAEIRRKTAQYLNDDRDAEGKVICRAADKIVKLDEAQWQNDFRRFIEPIREWAQEDEIVWLVPHDVLHYVPLHALKLDGRYLIERNPVVYSPSASVMKYCRLKRKGRRQHALVLGDPDGNRANMREEAQAVAKLFHTTPFLQQAATKQLVKDKLAKERGEIDVLHFACHGEFDQSQPLKSGILLAKNGDQEPKLSAEEIFALQMRAELVVLSACDTGVNDRKPGDELIGLTRSLIYAGTPSVIVSLWSVEDESTRFLMENFYMEWLTPRDPPITKAEALQKAQVALLRMTAEEMVARLDPAETPNDKNIDLAGGRNGDDTDIVHKRQTEMPLLMRQLAEEHRLRVETSIGPMGPDDLNHPKARPYFWAPFILVGDWL